MYRPTVRYDDLYKDYVTNLETATHLNRTQVIRAALFIAGHTQEFKNLMDPYLKRGHSFPDPLWEADENGLWYHDKAEVVQEKPQAPPKKVVQQNYQQTSPRVYSPGGNASINFNGRQL
ncbi:hypothetical protein [Halalkalibacter krulwichiae]|uniref:Uncharacterized protein n=1 Tax=Halalkalibacter krulwichiae TaxID=199441 RepID=A0A1X9MFB5_9BACI|nr:hypothetical protein [Halalkalibacter krulwichiae]ARK32106.1 hypothetical protein BkAM31D_20930 [Halalkalibacter krulwichiae]